MSLDMHPMSTSTSSLAGPPLAAPPPPTVRRTPRRARLSFLRRWVSPIVVVALWQLASSSGVLSERKLASPTTILATTRELIADGTLGAETLVSLQRVGIGFTLGALIGMALAITAGLSRIGDDAVDPLMQMLRTLPHFGLISLFITWMGVGEEPKVALIAMGVAFPLYLNTVAGIRGVETKILDAARSMNLTWTQRLRHVVIPGALPHTLTGLRQSLGIAWLSLIVAETIATQAGLGNMINNAREFQRSDIVVVGLVVYSLLGLTTDAVVRYLERRALAWRS
jgi:sulfonate transport system permease protein